MLVLQKSLKILIVLSLFVPLIILPTTFVHGFVVPRVLFFRSVVEIMFGVWLLLALKDWKQFGIRLTPITMAIGLFFLSIVLSTIFGVDPYQSVWDSQARMLGLISLLHYLAFYLIVTSTIVEWKCWRILFTIFLGIAAIVLLLAIAQKFNPQFLYNRGLSRVGSTVGVSSRFAGFCIVTFFLTLFLFIKEQSKGLKTFSATIGVLALVGIGLSQTRGSILGIAVGVFVLISSYLLVLERGPVPKWSLLIFFGFCGLLALGLFLVRDSPLLKKIPVVHRFAEISLSGGSTKVRMMTWEIALKAAREKPLLGWGPNNYIYAYQKYYNPEILEFGVAESSADDAHNILLNVLSEQGIMGLAAYLCLVLVPILFLWRRYRQGQLDWHVACIGTAFISAHWQKLGCLRHRISGMGKKRKSKANYRGRKTTRGYLQKRR